MWTVVFIAPTESKAELIAAKLSEEGMMVKVRSLNYSLVCNKAPLKLFILGTKIFQIYLYLSFEIQ